MTCVIGMRYDSRKGALLISDSRVMLGGDYFKDRKCFEVADGIVFAAAGYSGMAEKLLRAVRETRTRTRQTLPSEVLNIFEDEMAEIHNRYKMTRPYRFADDDNLLTGIVGIIEDSGPELYCLYENGFAEAIGNYHAVGHGDRLALNILRSLYDPAIPKDRALEIGVHAMIEVAKVDAMVDDVPQIAVLDLQDVRGAKTPTITMLNNGRDGTFQINSETVEQIKDKVKGVEETRTTVFHLLLDGPGDLRQRLDGLVKEYGDGRTK